MGTVEETAGVGRCRNYSIGSGIYNFVLGFVNQFFYFREEIAYVYLPPVGNSGVAVEILVEVTEGLAKLVN